MPYLVFNKATDLHLFPVHNTNLLSPYFRDGAALAAKTAKKKEEQQTSGDAQKKWTCVNQHTNLRNRLMLLESKLYYD